MSKDIEDQVKIECGAHAYFSSLTSQARGVLIFIKRELPAKILDTFLDRGGNIVSVLIEIEGKSILLEGIYGPNQDTPTFYAEEAFIRLTEWNPNFAIYVGD